MKEDGIISAAAKTFIESNSYYITIQIKEPEKVRRTFLDKILFRPIVKPETERTFKLTDSVTANMKRIAAHSLQLPKELFAGSVAEVMLPIIDKHIDTVVYIVAAGIQNTKREPDAELIEFIEDNFTSKDLYNTLMPILDNVGLDSFLNTIALAKGTIQILKPSASPLDGSELIASHIHQSAQSSDTLKEHLP